MVVIWSSVHNRQSIIKVMLRCFIFEDGSAAVKSGCRKCCLFRGSMTDMTATDYDFSQRIVNAMKRNSVLFYVLALLALVLCFSGVSRYHRNEASTIPLPPQTIAVNADCWSEVMDLEPYFHSDVIEAVAAARQQKKPILLLLTAKNCLYSKQMLDTTFQSNVLKPFLQRFVLINIDINDEKEICRRLNMNSTPTIQFISSEGIPLQRINGTAKPEDLIAQMNSTLQTIATHGRIAMR